MNLSRARLEAIRALLSYYELRDLILTAFARGERSELVRCSDVATFVSDRLGAELSPQFRKRVQHAAGLAGFTRVTRPQNVAHYRGMVRK